MTDRDFLAAWLRDAHAMEGQAITLLKTQIDRLESYPEELHDVLARLGNAAFSGFFRRCRHGAIRCRLEMFERIAGEGVLGHLVGQS